MRANKKHPRRKGVTYTIQSDPDAIKMAALMCGDTEKQLQILVNLVDEAFPRHPSAKMRNITKDIEGGTILKRIGRRAGLPPALFSSSICFCGGPDPDVALLWMVCKEICPPTTTRRIKHPQNPFLRTVSTPSRRISY